MKYLGGQTRCITGDVKMPNIKRLASIAVRKTLRLRKLDFHIVKNIRIKIYTKGKKSRRTKFPRADTSSHPRKGEKFFAIRR